MNRFFTLILGFVLTTAVHAQKFNTEVIRDGAGRVTAVRTYKDGVLLVENSFEKGKEITRMLQQDGKMKETVNAQKCALCSGENGFVVDQETGRISKHAGKVKTHGAPSKTTGRLSPTLQKPICYNDGVIHVYRLALPVDYSYFTDYFGSNRDLVRAAWNNIVTFCNELYTREVGIRFELVDDDRLMISNYDDRFFDTSNASTIHTGSTAKLNAYFGQENYDVAVLLHYLTSYDGMATMYGVYRHTGKGGATAVSSPTTIAHEIGHLFGANHTFTSNYDTGTTNALEPGDGTSLMSYGTPRDFFNLGSVWEIRSRIVDNMPYINADGDTLGTTSGSFTNFVHGVYTGNMPPQIDHEMLPDTIIIPKGTWVGFDIPATDPENDELHYFLHQADFANSSTSKARLMARAAKSTPFVSWAPSYSRDIYDPTWIQKDANTDPPSAGTYTMWMAACDGDWTGETAHAVNYDVHETTMIVRNSESPTKFTNDFAASYTGNQWIELTWDNDYKIFPKSQTCARITLSTDGGKTYTRVLKDNVPNWCRCYVLLPGDVSTDKAVIRIEIMKRQSDGRYLPTGAYHTSQLEPYEGGFTLIPSSQTPGEEPQVTEPQDDEEETEEEYVSAPALTLPYEAYPLKRRVLVEPFIGTSCGNAPAGMNNLRNALAKFDAKDYVAATEHFYSGTLQLEASQNIALEYGITASPRILVARDGYDQRYMSSPEFFPNQTMIELGIKRNLKNSVPVYLTLEGSTYDPATRKLKVKVSGFCSTSIPNPCISVCLTQDGIGAYQTGEGYITHNHVVRAYISDDLGEPLNICADGHFRTSFTYTVPQTLGSYSVDPSNVKVVAFVSTQQSFRLQQNYEASEVWNAVSVPVTELATGGGYEAEKIYLKMEIQQDKYYLGTMCLPYGVTLPEGVKAYSVSAEGVAERIQSNTVEPMQAVLLTAGDSIVALQVNNIPATTVTPQSVSGLHGEFNSRKTESGEHMLMLGVNSQGMPAFLPAGQTPTTSQGTYYASAGTYLPAGRGYITGSTEILLTIEEYVDEGGDDDGDDDDEEDDPVVDPEPETEGLQMGKPYRMRHESSNLYVSMTELTHSPAGFDDDNVSLRSEGTIVYLSDAGNGKYYINTKADNTGNYLHAVNWDAVPSSLSNAWTITEVSEGKYTLYQQTALYTGYLGPDEDVYGVPIYCDKNPAQNFIFEKVVTQPTKVQITITSAGSGTYASEYALDFSKVSGLNAYVCTGLASGSGKAIMQKMERVEANMGLFVSGTPGTYDVPIYEGDDFDELTGDDCLIGNISGTTISISQTDGIFTNYILQKKSGDVNPRFYKVNIAGNNVANNRAYLQIPTGSNSKEVLDIADDPTSITETRDERRETREVYNLSGIHVGADYKGVVIRDGKKVLVK